VNSTKLHTDQKQLYKIHLTTHFHLEKTHYLSTQLKSHNHPQREDSLKKLILLTKLMIYMVQPLEINLTGLNQTYMIPRISTKKRDPNQKEECTLDTGILMRKRDLQFQTEILTLFNQNNSYQLRLF